MPITTHPDLDPKQQLPLHHEGNRFPTFYPLSARLGLQPVSEGFDALELKEVLGDARYAKLYDQVTKHSALFVCAHRTYPEGHTHPDIKYPEDHPLKGQPLNLKGYEVPCFYAKDVEAFLASEAQ